MEELNRLGASVSLLLAVTYKHFAVEDRARFAIQDSLVELVTAAVRLPVIDY